MKGDLKKYIECRTLSLLVIARFVDTQIKLEIQCKTSEYIKYI